MPSYGASYPSGATTNVRPWWPGHARLAAELEHGWLVRIAAGEPGAAS
jgi:hypothetical protein